MIPPCRGLEPVTNTGYWRYVTVKLMVKVLVTPPPLAVTVKEVAPAALVEAADTVKVLEPVPGAAMLSDAKVAVTPLGTPVTDNATAASNPFTRAVFRTMCAEPPAATLAFGATEVKLKLGVNTVRLTD
jgi:hypothetical protein